MKRLLSIIVIVVFGLSLAAPLAYAAPSPTVTPIDIFEYQVENDVADGFPSAQLAVMKDGRLVYSNAWGYTRAYEADQTINPERTPVSTDTLYDIGGCTSVFAIGYAVNHLVSTGQLGFNTKVVDILGEQFVTHTLDYRDEPFADQLPDYETMLEWKRNLTVENLLRYQSGLPVSCRFHDNTFDFVAGVYDTDVPNPFYVASGKRTETLEKLCTVPLLYEPGTKTVVTDTDYILLTFIVEAVTGRRLDEYLRETFFEPLGLKYITFNPQKHGFGADDCASTELTGNTRDGLVSFPHVRHHVVQGEVHDEMAYYAMEGVSGHAGMFANAEDLARLAYLMIYDEGEYFSPIVTSRMVSANRDNPDYAMGWLRFVGDGRNTWLFGDYAGEDAFGITSFTHCNVIIDPTNALVIVYLTNSISSPIGFTDPENPVIENAKFTGNDFESAGRNAPMNYVYKWLYLA